MVGYLTGVMSEPELPSPTFVVIGAERAGTRWLRNNLALHPDVHIPWPIDPYFAERPAGTTLRSYRMQFRGAGEAPVIGEVGPCYLKARNIPRNVAQRIDEALPDVRLVAVLRQPVDRMVSAHRDLVIHGRLSPKASLFDLVRRHHRDLEEPDLIGAGRYAANLYPYRRRFGDRLLVVFTDDIRDDPTKVYDQVLAHIGAPTGFVPPHLDRVLYSNAASRWAAGSELDDEQRRIVYMLYRRDVAELEAMVGRYLPAWDPGPPPLRWRESLPWFHGR
jgi:hypothetical protein